MKKMKSFRFRGLAFRYGFYILSSIFIVFIIAFAYTFSFTYKILVQDAEQHASNVTQLAIARIRSVLQPIEEVPHLLSQRIVTSDKNLDPVLRSLGEFIQQNKEVYGSCIAYEPYRFEKKQKYFAPYLYERNDSVHFKNLNAEEYDYLNQPWYTIPKATGKSVWSTPYFDKGGGEMLMCTYSVPFYRMERGALVFNGVITMDISLETLRQIVDSIRVYRTGYGFLISKNGRIITYPDTSRINMDIRDVARNTTDTNVVKSIEKMMKGESGFVRLRSIREEKPSWMFYSPVTSTEWSFGLIFPSEDLFASFFDFAYRLVIIFVISILVLLVIIIWITRRFTRPLTKLAYATREMGRGNFIVNLPVYKAKDEITELSNSFSLMQEELKQYIENLQLTTSAKEKMEGEIGVARTIQLGMLPKTFPKRSDCDISAVLEPARGIGGDLYDFLFTADNKLYFAIGDVSGKGVPAALFMAITRTLFRAGIEKGKPIHHLVADLNNELCRENPNQMFVTFIVGLFDLFTGELNLCNAGHNPPVIIRKNGEIEKLPQRDGLPLGIFEQSVYTFSTIKLSKGEYFIAYTDGITDALNEKEELYGEERLFQYLTHTHRKTSNEIIEGTLEDVRAFTGGGDPFDDITMLVVKYLEVSFTEDTDPKQITDTVSIRLLNQVSEITTLSQWLELASERWNLSPKQAYTVNIVLEELISNIIFYGYEDQEEHSIDVEISKSGTTLTIITIDEGKPFNILEQAVPVDTLSTAEDRSIGGLGIHLVRTLMDHVEYRRESEKNIVVLTKELNP